MKTYCLLRQELTKVVEMQIKGAGAVMSWQIRRYKYSLRYDYERELLVSQSTHYRTEQMSSPVIMLLSEPERKNHPIIIKNERRCTDR